MKKIFLLFSVCALAACTGKAPVNGPEAETTTEPTEEMEVEAPYNTLNEEQMKREGNEFLNAIVSGDLQKALTYFSHNYVAEQHDQFQNGNTKQFITDFFANDYTTEEGSKEWKNIELSDIKGAQVIEVDTGDGLSGVIFVELELQDGKKYVGQFTMEMEMPGSETPTLIGAVG